MTKDTKHAEEPTIKELSDDELEAAQGAGAKGGQVETTWIVEEGEGVVGSELKLKSSPDNIRNIKS